MTNSLGESPSEQESIPGTKAQGSYAEMEEDKGIPGRGLEKGLLKVGKVTKLHGGQFLGQRALKGSSGLGSLWPGFSYCYQMWGEILQRYAKQAGAKWLKKSACLASL